MGYYDETPMMKGLKNKKLTSSRKTKIEMFALIVFFLVVHVYTFFVLLGILPVYKFMVAIITIGTGTLIIILLLLLNASKLRKIYNIFKMLH